MTHIDEQAENIINTLSIKKPSIDVDSIADHYNINITYQDFDDDSSGLLLIQNGKAIIAINIDNSPNRQRFTIAHELGHYFLHANNKENDLFIDQTLYHRNDKSSHGTYKQEIQANKFAAALLMPEEMIKEVIENEELDLSDDLDLLLLSNKFKVSEKAMSYRLGNLGLSWGIE